MRKLLLIISVLLASTKLSAQKDSLLRALKTAKDDTAKVRMLLFIGKAYSSKNYDSFYYYAKAADDLSKKLHSDKYDFYINCVRRILLLQQ